MFRRPLKRVRTYLDGWLGYSVRRRLLDAALESERGEIMGRVVEIGSGNEGRRGRFVPPTANVGHWMFLDLDAGLHPDTVADVRDLPLKSGSIDTVICLEVLEYVSDSARALAEFSRILAPGGKLILSVPFLHRCDHPNDLIRYTEFGLRGILEDAGLEPIRIRTQGAALAVAANILQYAVRAQPKAWKRHILAILALGPLAALSRMDCSSAKRLPNLTSFSTGYLVVAISRGGQVNRQR